MSKHSSGIFPEAEHDTTPEKYQVSLMVQSKRATPSRPNDCDGRTYLESSDGYQDNGGCGGAWDVNSMFGFDIVL